MPLIRTPNTFTFILISEDLHIALEVLFDEQNTKFIIHETCLKFLIAL